MSIDCTERSEGFDHCEITEYNEKMIAQIASEIEFWGCHHNASTCVRAVTLEDPLLGENIVSALIDKDLVEAVIVMPKNLHHYKRNPDVILVISNDKPPHLKGRVFLWEIPRDVKKVRR